MATTLAIFSDVHANLPALEAVLADIDSGIDLGEIDGVYCLGDLVGYAPWPNEVVASVRTRAIPTIAGNYDEGVGAGSGDCGCAYQTDEDKHRGNESITYTNAAVTDPTRKFLRSLPRHIRLKIAGPGRSAVTPIDVLLVHGSPRRVNEYLFEDRPDRTFVRIMEDEQADVMLFGHTHKPYHKVITTGGAETAPQYRHAINTGSVGKPKDGDPRAGYVLLTIDAERGTDNPEYCTTEFVRIEYDVERAVGAIQASPLPDAFAQMLREAR